MRCGLQRRGREDDHQHDPNERPRVPQRVLNDRTAERRGCLRVSQGFLQPGSVHLVCRFQSSFVPRLCRCNHGPYRRFRKRESDSSTASLGEHG
jgi:hypothetical protein